jgi:hypothetical protein
MTTWVYCTAQVERLHKWDGAVDKEEVKYLMYLHRHVFHVKAWVEVFDDDREVEFIMLKHRVEKLVDGWDEVVGSCEMMARNILTHLQTAYGDKRHYKVEVSEDGENGAMVET